MKRSVKIAFCGLMSALGTAFMLMTYFPYFTYAVPALAGLLTMVVLIEISAKWAFATYAVTAVLSFLFAETEAKLMYIFILGIYPVLKALMEKIGSRAVQYVFKFGYFNIAVFAVYSVLHFVFGFPFEVVGKYTAIAFAGLLLLGNFTFLLYDVMLYRVAQAYVIKIKPTVGKIMRKR